MIFVDEITDFFLFCSDGGGPVLNLVWFGAFSNPDWFGPVSSRFALKVDEVRFGVAIFSDRAITNSVKEFYPNH